MRVERLPENIRPGDSDTVTFKDMGIYSEIRFGRTNAHSHILKINAENYVILATGELKQFNHTVTRAESIINVNQTMARLRDLIRANVQNPEQCRWATVTYAADMRDTKQLYEDYRRFNQRFQRYLEREHHTRAEWIAVAEPQARGTWHMHVIYIFEGTAPYIPNEDLARLWGLGFTKMKALQAADDCALYLSAYLTDLPIESPEDASNINPGRLKIIGEGEEKKAFLKGGRIGMYPTGTRLYRCSKGIKKPIVTNMAEQGAQERLIDAELNFEKTVGLYDENDGLITTYNYRHFKRIDYNEIYGEGE